MKPDLLSQIKAVTIGEATRAFIVQAVTVRYSGGAYNTNRISGQSGSSTSDARSAVQRLAGKLFDDAWDTTCHLSAASSSCGAPEAWVIHAVAKGKATAGSPA